ncbi:MAG: sigma-70 family RNA polymerase sigma factor [Muribaculaceae bacterium]|nr:sigma-70 family RNA polymerase sigma factor [Muribaculaceae bacterium]
MTDLEFKNIMLPCYRRMYAIAYAILRNADDASDAVQDAMSSLWQRHIELLIPDDAVAFCCKTVRNTCIDILRRNSKRYFDNIEDAKILPSRSDTDSSAEYSSSRKFILELLSTFKEKQRKILVLNIFSQLSANEISEIIGESEENVRTILCRGRKKIKECLNDEI